MNFKLNRAEIERIIEAINAELDSRLPAFKEAVDESVRTHLEKLDKPEERSEPPEFDGRAGP